MRTTKKDLEKRLNVLMEISGEQNVILDFNSAYGGYRIVKRDPQTGAHFGVFGMSSCVARVKASEMMNIIDSLIYGIEYEQRKQKRINKV